MAQPYFKIPANRVFLSENNLPETINEPVALISATGSFHSQVKLNGSFLDPENDEKANLGAVDTPELRVSDDLEMAIEDSDLNTRQPKTFFATDQVVSSANQALGKSRFKLISGNARLRIWTSSNRSKELSNVLPQQREQELENPLVELRASQNCQAFSGEVVDKDVRATEGRMVPSCLSQLADQKNALVVGGVHLEVAQLVAHLLKTGRKNWVKEMDERERNIDTPEDLFQQKQLLNEIARDYVDALNSSSEKRNRILKELKINQFAAPEVGEAYVISTIAAEDRNRQVTDIGTQATFAPKWPYHFGAVVARSGTDTVTLENYARGDEKVGDQHSDPRWYFQMYGGGSGQSFHEANVATGEYANPITMTLRRRETIQSEEAFSRKVTIGGIAVGVGLLAITLGVLYKYGYIKK